MPVTVELYTIALLSAGKVRFYYRTVRRVLL